jgi:hypothetical protein
MNDEHDIEIDDDDAVLTLDAPVLVTQAPVPIVATEEDLDAIYGEDEDADALDADLEFPDDHAADDPRVAELTATVDKLKAAELNRESRRVRNKVKAASGGAGLAGVIPIVLQLTGALNVDPEIASAVVAGVAVLGAFVAGWVTPERQSAIVAEVLKPQ